MPVKGDGCQLLLARRGIGAGDPTIASLHPNKIAGSPPARPAQGRATGFLSPVHFRAQIAPSPAEPKFEFASLLVETAPLRAGALPIGPQLVLYPATGLFLDPWQAGTWLGRAAHIQRCGTDNPLKQWGCLDRGNCLFSTTVPRSRGHHAERTIGLRVQRQAR